MIETEEKYIYESPDGGETVYRRPFGSNSWDQKELVSVSDKKREEMENERLWFKWMQILRASHTDPHLKELLEQAEVYHALKNSPYDRYLTACGRLLPQTWIRYPRTEVSKNNQKEIK